MDALRRDEAGQALVFVVLLVGVAAAALSGLRAASDRIAGSVLDQRVAEAAVAAAGTAVEDLAVARAAQLGRELDRAETARLAADDVVRQAALAAARTIASVNGSAQRFEVDLKSYGLEIEVHLRSHGRTYIALLEPAP